MADLVPVLFPIWAAKTIKGLMQSAFTGNFTCHFGQGHLVAVEYSDGRCTCCGSQKKLRVAEPH
jgi:hypothetical protein